MTAPRTSFDLMSERLAPKPTPTLGPGVELGTSGLSRTGGWITEEFLTDLRGMQGLKKYREMRDNSPVVGAILYAIEMMARETGWRVEAGTEGGSGEADRLFVEECFEDMSAAFADTLGDILSCLPFGFSFHEIVYKHRQGP